MRNGYHKGKGILGAVLIVVLCLTNVQMAAAEPQQEELQLYAKAAVLMDADSGRILYGKNAQEQLPMASTTKIMTLIIALENSNPEDTLTVSSYAASMPNVQLHMKEGEQYRLKDLLYSLMLESHNDSAVAIAEHVAGSVEQFAALMNRKAEEIGCHNTCFITPNGLDASADFVGADGQKETRVHSTTAQDLAKIMSYCITKSPCKEQFLEITRTPSYSFCDVTGKRNFSCNNHNAFLNMMQGALSGKTGFTGNAGYCYVGALERDGRTYVVALLACGWPNHKTYKWSDTRQLMEYGLEQYNYRSFDEKEIPLQALEPLSIEDAQTDKIGETAQIDVQTGKESGIADGLLMREEEEITLEICRRDRVSAPIEKGTVVGYVTYLVGGEEWKRIELITVEGVERIDIIWCVQQVCRYWML